MTLNQPVLQDERFLADVRQAMKQEDGFRLWFLGQSGFLLQWRGRHLLLDPYLSDSLTRKYSGTNRPHERITARVVAPEKLDFIDAVTSSHHHTDHLDAETLIPLLRVNPSLRVIVPEASRRLAAERLQVDPARLLGLDRGGTLRVEPFEVTALAAAHENLDVDELGRCRYLGYVLQFGGWTVYHSGDTVLYSGLVEKLQSWSINVALLPINGRDPSRGVPGNLNGKEAAWLGAATGAGMVVPCHWDMFRFNAASPREFLDECARLHVNGSMLPTGGRLDYPA